MDTCKNIRMAERTTYKIGGPAEVMAFPETGNDVIELLKGSEISLVLGGGSNLLISDDGISGMTLNLGKTFLGINLEPMGKLDVLVRAGASVNLTKLASHAMEAGLSGLEFAHGIPGLLGGALVMNAGAFGNEIKDILHDVTVITVDGKEKKLHGDELDFGYRHSSFPKKCVIKEASIRLARANPELIRQRMGVIQRKRKLHQPLNAFSAGSVFKNPKNKYAGRLIETARLKGEQIGKAQISQLHANFIVNLGGASSQDVYGLIRMVENRVLEEFGVKLEREIKLVGEFKEIL